MAAGEEQANKAHRSRQAGPKKRSKNKKNKSANASDDNNKNNPAQNPKAFSFRSNVKAKRLHSRTVEKEQRKLHIPTIDRNVGDPPPFVVVVHGPPQVNFFDHSIKTTLTADPYEVVSWIERIEYTHYRRLHNLIVGLDVEWRPKFVKNIPEYPVAILQLCVGHHCLIFQIQHCKEIPQALTDFLSNENYSFVGVGIDEDVRKLSRDYNLNVFKTVDLRSAASKRWNDKEYMKKGLTALAKEAMEIEYKKSKRITLSNWSKRNLTDNQISYAAIDAFLSFEIGRSLKVQELS